MGQNHFARVPVAMYGGVLLMAAIAFANLAQALVAYHDKDPPISTAIGNDRKGKASLALYAIAIACTWVSPWLSMAQYAAVALISLVPDRRIERVLAE
jgi:uncharacterized membrane protein